MDGAVQSSVTSQQLRSLDAAMSDGNFDFYSKALNWLAPLHSYANSAEIVGNEIVIDVHNPQHAHQCWMTRGSLLAWGFDLTVKLKSLNYNSTVGNRGQLEQPRFNLKNMLTDQVTSSWATKNQCLLDGYKDLCTTAIHAVDEGLTFLKVEPYLGIEAILNKPIIQLIGFPVSVNDSEIAEAKTRCIRRAIETGGTAKDQYFHQWKGASWHKKITAIYLAGHEEVLLQISDGQSWQNEYWKNYVQYQA